MSVQEKHLSHEGDQQDRPSYSAFAAMESRRRNSMSIPFSTTSRPFVDYPLSPRLSHSPRLGSILHKRRHSTSTFTVLAVLPRRIPIVIIGAIVLVSFGWLVLTATPTKTVEHHPWSNLKLPFIESAPVPTTLPIDFDSSPVPAEWSCNPFKQFGRLVVDVDVPVSFTL